MIEGGYYKHSDGYNYLLINFNAKDNTANKNIQIWRNNDSIKNRYQIYRGNGSYYFDTVNEAFKKAVLILRENNKYMNNISEIMRFAALINDEDS